MSIPSYYDNRKPAVCPLCHGSGTQTRPPEGITWRGKPDPKWKVKCHGCHGKGWVTMT